MASALLKFVVALAALGGGVLVAPVDAREIRCSLQGNCADDIAACVTRCQNGALDPLVHPKVGPSGTAPRERRLHAEELGPSGATDQRSCTRRCRSSVLRACWQGQLDCNVAAAASAS